MPAEPLTTEDTPPRAAIALRRAVGWRVGVAMFAALALALVLQALLLLDKERELLTGIAVARAALDADELEAQVLRESALGLRLEESQSLARLMARQMRDDPRIESVQVFDSEGVVHFVAGLPPSPLSIDPEALRAIRQARDTWFDLDPTGPTLRLRVGVSAIDAEGLPAGGVLYRLHAQTLTDDIAATRATMLPRLAWTLAGVAVTLVPLLALAGRPGRGRWLSRTPPRTRLLAVALAVAGCSSLALSLQLLPAFSARIEPALEVKVERVAAGLAGRIGGALALGIPYDRLNGVPAYFDELLRRHPEVVALRLEGPGPSYASRPRDDRGEAGRVVAVPVTDGNGDTVALLQAGIDPGVAARQLRASALDLAIVFLVAIVVFNEVLGAILSGAGSAARGDAVAAGGRESQGLARLAVFLLILAEELTRAFLPLHVAGLARGGGLAAGTAIGLPISAYMASFALLTPFAGRWAARFGAGRTFALGTLLSALGFVGALLGDGYAAFVAARCLCAAGYAIGTMAIQHHFLHSAGSGGRARALALLVGAVQMAAICGAPIGSLLAQQFGTRAVFGGAAGLCLTAMALQLLGGAAGNLTLAAAQAPRLLPLLRRGRVLLALLGAALPIKLVLAGFLFYLVPIALQQQGYDLASTGRAMLPYYLLVAVCNPLGSWLADRFGWQRALVIGGGAAVGLGGLAGLLVGPAAALGSGPLALFIGIATLGIGTGLSAAPLQSLMVRDGPAAVVLLRTVERLGAVIGPLMAGSLLPLLAYGGTMAAIGAAMLAATLAFAAFYPPERTSP